MIVDKETQFLILDAYGQAIFAAKERGMTTQAARAAALNAAAKAVAKVTGQPITPEIVSGIIGS